MTVASATPATSAASTPGLGGFLAAVLSDRERFFTEVAEGERLNEKLAYGLGTLVALTALYGATAGAYAGALQALAAAVKLPVLFLGTLAICFPGFFVIQVLVGSRLRLSQVLALVLGALALTAILLGAVVPITAFFLLTGADYHFLSLLHVAIVLGSGLVGMSVLHEGLAYACEKRGVYPKKAMTIMKVWALLFAFVGIQMAWNLQPFVGDRGAPFRLFRHYEGNFYTAILYAVEQLVEPPRKLDSGRGPRAPISDDPYRRPEVRYQLDSRPPSGPDTTGERPR